jgi:hypothetical protein
MADYLYQLDTKFEELEQAKRAYAAKQAAEEAVAQAAEAHRQAETARATAELQVFAAWYNKLCEDNKRIVEYTVRHFGRLPLVTELSVKCCDKPFAHHVDLGYLQSFFRGLAEQEPLTGEAALRAGRPIPFQWLYMGRPFSY